jgi:hypothetical protein
LWLFKQVCVGFSSLCFDNEDSPDIGELVQDVVLKKTALCRMGEGGWDDFEVQSGGSEMARISSFS